MNLSDLLSAFSQSKLGYVVKIAAFLLLLPFVLLYMAAIRGVVEKHISPAKHG